jgi:glutamate synthase (NADPH/NADH) small chain
MGNPRGFLDLEYVHEPKRDPAERVHDHRMIFELMPVEEVRRQADRCMNCGIPFCHFACPVGNRIPRWNELVGRDDWQDAIEQLHATNNFPEFTGYICPAPCQAACVLEINDDPVTIKQVELETIERAWKEGWVQPRPPSIRTGRRIAVVGSGPAGMAVAAQLNSKGHSVVVLERSEGVGGLMRIGVPDFKLEKWVIDRRVAVLEAEGVEFRCNVEVGGSGDGDPSIEDLRSGYDAVVLAVGALKQRLLDVDGADLEGVHLAMDYLSQHNRLVARAEGRVAWDVAPDHITAKDKHVVVIGGGDTAADCIATALREGAIDVSQLDRYPEPAGTRNRELADWPALPRRQPTSYALEEGGSRRYAEVITGLSGSGRRLTTLHGTTVQGPPAFEPVNDGAFERPADLVLVAVGFTGPEPELIEALDLALDDRGNLQADRYLTSAPGVFTAGDARVGASLVVTAIDEGRKCAEAVDAFLAAS